MVRDILFCSTVLVLCAHAHAYDLLLPISGSIADNSCNLLPASTQLGVTLGGVNSRQGYAINSAVGQQMFVINLEKCGAAASGVVVTFQGIADLHDAQLLQLTQATGGTPVASGLAVEILDQAKHRLPINSPSSSLAIGAGNNALTFYAQYRITGAVTEGQANAMMTFEMEYQ